MVLLHDHQHRNLVITGRTGGIEQNAEGVGSVVVLGVAMRKLEESLESALVPVVAVSRVGGQDW